MTMDIDALVRHRYAQLDKIRLHYVEAGPCDGPLVVLLHGFPEFWYSWKHQIAALSEAGYRVVAPDLRGYNMSDKPSFVVHYTLPTLVEDVQQLLDVLEVESAAVAGHDWGGVIAWWFAMLSPHRLSRLVACNSPHPGHFPAMFTSARQLRRSAYILMFQLPGFAERQISADGYARIGEILSQAGFLEHEVARYRDALERSSATAMLNYYRALVRSNPFDLSRLRPIAKPTQVIWGRHDDYLGIEFAEPPAKWVWDNRLRVLEDADHWVTMRAPEQVNATMLEFLAPLLEARS